MPVLFKLLLVGGALIALPSLSTSKELDASASTEVVSAPGVGRTQDPLRSDFRAEVRWSFAVLSYTSLDGKAIELAARRLSKVWVVKGPDGQMFLEIVHENSDYSFVAVREFHFIRRSEAFTAAEVPIVRTTLDEMAFPSFK